MDGIVFHASAILGLIAAVVVVLHRSPVYSTISLIVFFVMMSFQFLVLRAPFLAVVEVFIYGGAILVLFVFVIMLLNLTPDELREGASRGRRAVAGTFSLLLFCLLCLAIGTSTTVRNPPAPNLAAPPPTPELAAAGEIENLGRSLFTTHVLAFEFASIMILVAIVGSIYLTKKRKAVAAGGVAP